MHSPCLYLEFGHSSLKARAGDDDLEAPLERQENGRLTERCRHQVTEELRAFLGGRRWRGRPRALCAIGARGVSLRRLTLPAAPKDELDRLLQLQIESEFPLPPSELAWGHGEFGPGAARNGGGSQPLQVVVVAARREALADYAAVLSACNLNATFTLGALARSRLCPSGPGAFALLDIGRQHSELATFEDGIPTAVRLISWGGEDLTRAIAAGLAVSPEEAERLKTGLGGSPGSNGELSQRAGRVVLESLAPLVDAVRSHWNGTRFYLTGETSRLPDLPATLARRLGEGVRCERLPLVPGEGGSAAIVGLQRSVERDGERPVLALRTGSTNGAEKPAQPTGRRWAGAALALLIALLALPYLEALLRKPALVRKLAEIRADRDRLATIDQELDFLQTLRNDQPPYLDIIGLLAGAAPSGVRIDALSLTRRGEMSVRATARDGQQAVDLRSKLIASGFFSNVVLDEQTPSPDRQKVTVRLTAQWLPGTARESAAGALARSAAGKSATPGKGDQPGASAMPPGGVPATPPAGIESVPPTGGAPIPPTGAAPIVPGAASPTPTTIVPPTPLTPPAPSDTQGVPHAKAN